MLPPRLQPYLRIVSAVAAYHGLSAAQLRAPGKPAPVMAARMDAAWVLDSTTDLTHYDIAKLLNRNFESIRYYKRQILNRLETEPKYQTHLGHLLANPYVWGGVKRRSHDGVVRKTFFNFVLTK